MESSPSYTGPPEAPTTEMAPVEPTTAVHAALDVSGTDDRCSACAARLAEDQRYCVECGQPRRATRVPALLREADLAPGTAAAAAAATATAPGSAAARLSANTALIAGIGVLLLAMGIGVFIGSRTVSGDGAAQRFPGQVTVVSSGTPGAAAATTTPAAAAATPTASTGRAATTAPKQTAAKKAATPAAATKPPANAVHVGSPGSGPGYQNGKFTGNFFGGG